MMRRAADWFLLGSVVPCVCGAMIGQTFAQQESNNTALPSPISVSPSQFFEGLDGPWSSFELRVGNPAQNIRVFPGTSSPTTLVVLLEGCQIINVTDCPNSRGGLFNISASKTWNQVGLFNLGFENGLGYTDNGEFGFDSVGLGYLGSGGPVVNHSVVGGVAQTEFYLGVLGLNPQPTNFTLQNDPEPSFMQSLKNNSLIPSLSYSYTAGAPYRLNKALGNLILGGYDTGLYTDTNSSYRFFSDQQRDLTVGVSSITTNATKSETSLLTSEPISMFIDSSIPEIYLPLDVCHAFENAFHLTYNNSVDRYLVNDTLHKQLVASNPSVTFTITTAVTGGSNFNITFPYASFDLEIQPPLLSNATRYFPLRRAANETQYTLGRTFLQEAYLIVDYERGNFSVHPRDWNANAKSNVVAILPPVTSEAAPTSSASPAPATTSTSHALSGGAIGGIVAGVIVIAIVASALLWYYVLLPRKRRAAEAKKPPQELPAEEVVDEIALKEAEPVSDTPEADGAALRELEGSEMDTKSPLSRRSELESPESSRLSELPSPAPPAQLAELLSNEIYEMPGSDVSELQGSSATEAGNVTKEVSEKPKDGDKDTAKLPDVPEDVQMDWFSDDGDSD